MKDIVRVLRVVEYIGPRDWVENTVQLSIQGERRFNDGCVIRGTTLGTFPDLLKDTEVKRGYPGEVGRDLTEIPTTGDVINALLLTEFAEVPGDVIDRWTDGQKLDASRWAQIEHLAASDNCVGRMKEPQCVTDLKESMEYDWKGYRKLPEPADPRPIPPSS